MTTSNTLTLIETDTRQEAQLRALSAIATPVTIEHRDILLARAKAITKVANPEQVREATETAGLIKGLGKKIEAARVELKKPVIIIGSAIDGVAKETMATALKEATRLENMLGAYQAEQERKRQAEIRRQEEDAHRQKEEAERKAKEAQEAAEKARQEAQAAVSSEGGEGLTAALEKEIAAEEAAEKASEAVAAASAPVYMAPVAATPKVAGAAVKTQWEFEVTNIAELYKALPTCVDLVPKKMSIKDAINTAAREAGEGVTFSIPGLRIFKSTKVSTRSR